MNRNEVDIILIQYEKTLKTIWKGMTVRIPRHLELDDIFQECMFCMWQLLEKKYDPGVGDVKNFVIGHAFNVHRGVMEHLAYNNSYVSPRSSNKKRDRGNIKNIDFFDIKDMNFYNIKTINWGYFLAQSNNDIYIDSKIDTEIIKKAIRQDLSKKAKIVFDFITREGENPSSRRQKGYIRGEEGKTKSLQRYEIADELDLSSSVAVQYYMNEIRRVATRVLKKFTSN